MLPPIKVNLYHKADWDSIISSLSKQLIFYKIRFLVLYLLTTLILLTLSIIQPLFLLTLFWIFTTIFPKKTIKPNTSIPYSIQLLVKQKRKIKRAFIKTRNPFLKSTLNAISKKIKKQIKKPSGHRHSKQNSESSAKQWSEELENSEKRNGLS